MPFSQKRRCLIAVIEDDQIAKDISDGPFEDLSEADARRLRLLRDKCINKIIFLGIWERLVSSMKRRLNLFRGN